MPKLDMQRLKEFFTVVRWKSNYLLFGRTMQSSENAPFGTDSSRRRRSRSASYLRESRAQMSVKADARRTAAAMEAYREAATAEALRTASALESARTAAREATKQMVAACASLDSAVEKVVTEAARRISQADDALAIAMATVDSAVASREFAEAHQQLGIASRLVSTLSNVATAQGDATASLEFAMEATKRLVAASTTHSTAQMAVRISTAEAAAIAIHDSPTELFGTNSFRQ